MDKNQNMQSFFEFLEDHMEGWGFKGMKNKYLIMEEEAIPYEIQEDGTYKFIPVEFKEWVCYNVVGVDDDEHGGYWGEETRFRCISINPKKLSLHRKILKDDNSLYFEVTETLYDDLIKLYKLQLGNLKKSFANSLMTEVVDSNRNSFNEGMLIKLNYFLELSDCQDFVVLSPDGTPINLLHKFLKDAKLWIQKQGIPVEFSTQIDTSEINSINLDASINNFNSMPLMMVWDYFKPLTNIKSKNGKPYLSDEQLIKFIREIFINDNNPLPIKIELNVEDGERQSLIYKFYQFYNNSKFDYESTKNCKQKYVRLLTDNFTKFDYEKVFNNFHKKP